MSTHEANVVPVVLEPHSNADSLSIVMVGEFQLVVRRDDWVGKDKGIFIPPDAIVDVSREEFRFLDRGRPFERIKCIKLRGEYSTGLLIHAPEDSQIGDDYFDKLGLSWWDSESELAKTGGLCVKGPSLVYDVNKYDIENGKQSKYKNLFTVGETVYVSEKCHGCFAAFLYDGVKFHVKSRGEWKAEDTTNLFWRAFRSNKAIEEFCVANPNYLICGEVVGQVQRGFNYGCKPGEVSFVAFDIRTPVGQYLSPADFIAMADSYGVPRVPNLGFMPFDFDSIAKLAEGQSKMGSHVIEGCVIKPISERRDARLGRVFIKIVGNGYLCAK